MDMYRQTEQAVIITSEVNVPQKHKSIAQHIFTTNWGFIVIGGLVALAIGVSALHSGRAESMAKVPPEIEVETTVEAPLS